MGTMGKILKVGAMGAIAAVGVCGAAVILTAPRRHGEELDDRWRNLSRYRYAHRGLHDNQTPAPENSLAAFRLAREWGYGSELDVHLSADGVPVVIHDSKLKRACGTDGIVEDMTLAELREMRLFHTDETIPTLTEVLEVYEEGEGPCPPLVVELKVHDDNAAILAKKALELLDVFHVPYCIESFDPRPLWWLRRNRPDVIRGQLSEHFFIDKDSDLSWLRGAIASALALNLFSRPDFVAYRFEHRHHPALRLACGPLGAWQVYWTVGNEDDLKAADGKGAVSIFEGFNPNPMRED